MPPIQSRGKKPTQLLISSKIVSARSFGINEMMCQLCRLNNARLYGILFVIHLLISALEQEKIYYKMKEGAQAQNTLSFPRLIFFFFFGFLLGNLCTSAFSLSVTGRYKKVLEFVYQCPSTGISSSQFVQEFIQNQQKSEKMLWQSLHDEQSKSLNHLDSVNTGSVGQNSRDISGQTPSQGTHAESLNFPQTHLTAILILSFSEFLSSYSLRISRYQTQTRAIGKPMRSRNFLEPWFRGVSDTVPAMTEPMQQIKLRSAKSLESGLTFIGELATQKKKNLSSVFSSIRNSVLAIQIGFLFGIAVDAFKVGS